MEWKAGIFYKVRNKGDKKRKYLIGWGHRVNLVWGKKA